jgi:hypothetical protein
MSVQQESPADKAEGATATARTPRPRAEYVAGWTDQIPALLKQCPQWVCWRYAWRVDRHGLGKWTKVPVTPRPVRGRYLNAKTDDPSTWGTFKEACTAYIRKPWRFDGRCLDGIGFVFSPDDPYCGWDVDNCLDDQGNISPWARSYVERFQTYAEVSPSGHGIKFIATGKLPGGGRRKTGMGPDKTGAVEAYDRERFFTITGNSWNGHPTTVGDLSGVVLTVHEEVFGKKFKPSQKAPRESAAPLPGDDEVINLARQYNPAFGHLFDRGDTSRNNGDVSAADFALCGLLAYWTRKDAAAIDRIFRRSALMRTKWDERRGETTYGGLTIANAIAQTNDVYEPRAKDPFIVTAVGPSANGDGKHPGDPPPTGTEPPPPKRPRILVTTDEHQVNDQAVAALAGDRDVYTRGFALVTVQSGGESSKRFNRPAGSPRICELPHAQLRERLTREAEWVKERTDRHGEVSLVPVNPPDWSVAAVAVRGVWPGLRALEAVVESPALRPDGTVLDAPGYDETTGLLYRPNGRFPAVPARPTLDDARGAVAVLLDLVQEFAFASTAHQTAWLAAALTPLARFAISGPTPLFLLDATAPGSGKGLLADVIAVIATGRTMPRTAYPDSDEEMRKRITAVALAGDRLMLLDNVTSNLGGAALDAALTGTTWRDRILGRSEMTAELPLLTTWFATANNATLRGDLVRRTIPVRLEPKVEKPDEQTGFKYPRLLAHVVENRAALVAAGLTILRAYTAAGCPDQKLTPFGSFEGWSDLVRSAVFWTLEEDPCAVRKGLADADSEALARTGLVDGWAELPGGKDGLAAAGAIQLVKGDLPDKDGFRKYGPLYELFTERGRNGEMITAKSLGHWLRSVEGRVIGRKSMHRRQSGGIWLWYVKNQPNP